MPVNVKKYSDQYAYDISKKVISKAELIDINAIDQNIEMILCTGYNERLFNLSFGSVLPSYLFDIIDEISGEKLLDDIIDAIRTWENRVTVIASDASLQILDDEHAIVLDIPYIINQNNIAGRFKKQINF